MGNNHGNFHNSQDLKKLKVQSDKLVNYDNEIHNGPVFEDPGLFQSDAGVTIKQSIERFPSKNETSVSNEILHSKNPFRIDLESQTKIDEKEQKNFKKTSIFDTKQAQPRPVSIKIEPKLVMKKHYSGQPGTNMTGSKSQNSANGNLSVFNSLSSQAPNSLQLLPEESQKSYSKIQSDKSDGNQFNAIVRNDRFSARNQMTPSNKNSLAHSTVSNITNNFKLNILSNMYPNGEHANNNSRKQSPRRSSANKINFSFAPGVTESVTQSVNYDLGRPKSIDIPTGSSLEKWNRLLRNDSDTSDMLRSNFSRRQIDHLANDGKETTNLFLIEYDRMSGVKSDKTREHRASLS